ncbi:hypothetical protein P4H66_30540 [Paenibacillus dokdonensis]|uniref:Uncharacterized protein n=1 Tax=Paenibacillus dokdonensis TaxID=2567944 RepID=A0ABU6GWN1_9BACL|nr:hypothetical protein [Paenibacillus dokdonensis]MEC0244155.1 hypothetical protein [Paenibacillus dokdonensis]
MTINPYLAAGSVEKMISIEVEEGRNWTFLVLGRHACCVWTDMRHNYLTLVKDSFELPQLRLKEIFKTFAGEYWEDQIGVGMLHVLKPKIVEEGLFEPQ